MHCKQPTHLKLYIHTITSSEPAAQMTQSLPALHPCESTRRQTGLRQLSQDVLRARLRPRASRTAGRPLGWAVVLAVVGAHGLGARECEREPVRVLLEDGCSRWHTWRDPSVRRTLRQEQPGPM